MPTQRDHDRWMMITARCCRCEKVVHITYCSSERRAPARHTIDPFMQHIICMHAPCESFRSRGRPHAPMSPPPDWCRQSELAAMHAYVHDSRKSALAAGCHCQQDHQAAGPTESTSQSPAGSSCANVWVVSAELPRTATRDRCICMQARHRHCCASCSCLMT